MPKYRIQGTKYVFVDAIVEAKDEDEAIAMENADNLDWFEVGNDWEFHTDLVCLEENDND